MARVSAYSRLRELPEVFTTNTLTGLLGGDAKMASVYLSRWKSDGMIESLGPRAKVHFNLVRNPEAPAVHWFDAISMAIPGAMIGGVTAVHDAGWTTQIPAETDIVAPLRRTAPEIFGVNVSFRPKSWFKKAHSEVARPGLVPTLNPAFALADLWHSGEWQPDPDDLEWDLIDVDDLREKFAMFSMAIPESWEEEIAYQTSAPGAR